jgi:hypothetical protein
MYLSLTAVGAEISTISIELEQVCQKLLQAQSILSCHPCDPLLLCSEVLNPSLNMLER